MVEPMTTIGLVGAGYMGSAVGATLKGNGHDVLTTLAGRSPRTVRLVQTAGLATVADLTALVGQADIVLVVTPPAAALTAAGEISAAARTAGARPLVADLNAVSPSTMDAIARALGGLDLVDGSISGGPPTTSSDTVVYLSGPRADELASLGWTPARPIVVGDVVGTASAIKMCTASVYKGLSVLLAQALRTADHHGVLDYVLADLSGLDERPQIRVAMATTKADRYVAEMLEIAATQAGAGLTGDLFEAYARVFEDLARTPLAGDVPETLDRTMTAAQVLARLHRT
jgi:3-hydroxyisobutyrate dehydrogenase-like beta-hydroxyacid dehydrogenase